MQSSRRPAPILNGSRLALNPGARLGPYEILSSLGAGGMGEVYRERDTKLKRYVAIKILPSSLAADADRLARFQREAEVLASLNHPNIAAIYGLEDADGVKALCFLGVPNCSLLKSYSDSRSGSAISGSTPINSPPRDVTSRARP